MIMIVVLGENTSNGEGNYNGDVANITDDITDVTSKYCFHASEFQKRAETFIIKEYFWKEVDEHYSLEMV
jgi:hypothetical protein